MTEIDNILLNYGKEEVLKNKLNINTIEELEKQERLITSYKLAKLYLDPGKQTFDVEHYLSIHKFLFEDIYDFAGKFRTEKITKRISFCSPMFIYSELERTLKDARNRIKTLTSKEAILDYIPILHSDLDVIHPFREGNGRTEREFIRQYINFVCEFNSLGSMCLDYNKVDKNEFVDAVVKADALLDYTDLRKIFENILIEDTKNKTK